MLKDFARSVLIALLSAMVFAGPAAKIARGQAVQGYPLTANNFVETTPHGFGDFNNSWAQAMVWWNNNLYVGTSRDSLCASLEGVHLEGIVLLGLALANQYLPYPPPDPNLTCTPDPADLPLAAQIWQWSPGTNAWTQVYESPDTLPNPGHGPPDPPETGKFLPYEASFRGFAPYTESDGTQALYAFGVNSTLLWDSTKLPPPRILRTTDGANWTPLPQDPGTFLGDLPFNSDHSTYRSPVVYNGIMFTLCGPINGQGSLIASFNPSQGDNAWFLAAPASMFFYELANFNGWLYLGAYNPGTGYGVYKTNAQGMPPYQLIQIVPPGAGLTNMPSPSVVSMFVHNNRLYVGTATFPEMLRINTDDTWDLVMGAPRIDPVTEQWKYPTSNVGPGFGLTLNDHVWYMADANNYLYAGTYNASTGSHTDPVYGPILQPTMGAQMFVTGDDWHWTAVTTNGFSNPADPHGGMWDYGFRTMSNTPYGLFVGTANDYYGLTVFRATKGVSPPVQAPGNLEIEPTQSGSALLSWQAGIYATSYQVWRAVLIPIQIRYNFNFEGFNGIPVGSIFITDMYVSPYQLLGTTTSLTFLDSTPEAGHTYMYYIVATGSRGTSPPSNLTTFPNLLPPLTFAQLVTEVNTLAQRQRFASTDPGGTKTLTVVETAQAQAAACQITTAIKTLTPQTNSRALLVPDLYDYQALIAKMTRRLQNYTIYPAQVISNEFCTP